MVDTINPQTGQSDSFEGKNEAQNLGANNFYAGFDQPENVNVSLVNNGTNSAPVDALNQQNVPKQQPQVHSSFNSNPTNVKGNLILIGICLAFIILVNTVTFFVASSYFNSQIDEKEKEFSTLNIQLSDLQVVPTALSPQEDTKEAPESTAPVVETPVQVETPVNNVPKEETPIVVPIQTNPDTGGTGKA